MTSRGAKALPRDSEGEDGRRGGKQIITSAGVVCLKGASRASTFGRRTKIDITSSHTERRRVRLTDLRKGLVSKPTGVEDIS